VKREEQFLKEALKEAEKAYQKKEVPVGAVIVKEEKIIARAHNQTITLNDPAAHAEIIALRKAARKLGNYRLEKTKLYVTLEPCPMCAGALIWARIEELVFGARDSKAGACGSVVRLFKKGRFNHYVKVKGKILEKECRALLQKFFSQRRKKENSL
jgi:tRNA(adenine34) deaminase